VGGAGEQRTEAIRCGACYYSIVLNAHRVTSVADTDIDAVRKRNNAERIVVMCIGYIFLTYDVYKSSLRHIRDPVLSSLKMKGVRLLFSKVSRFQLHSYLRSKHNTFTSPSPVWLP
jgi:hypothetical protein